MNINSKHKSVKIYSSKILYYYTKTITKDGQTYYKSLHFGNFPLEGYDLSKVINVTLKMKLINFTTFIDNNFKNITDDITPVWNSEEDKQLVTKYCNIENTDNILQQILITNQFYDFELKCTNGSTKCHKCILNIFSPYFRSLFNSEMIETQKNCLEIKNFPHVVVEFSIKFLYGYNVDNITDHEIFLDALQFFIEYSFIDMIDACSKKVLQMINSNNFGKIAYCFQTYPELEAHRSKVIEMIKKI